MSWIAPAVIGGLHVLGGLFGNRAKKTTEISNSQYSSTRMPVDVRPETWLPFESDLVSTLMRRLQQPIDMSGYETTGIADINRSYDLARTSLENRLASAGLLGSPMVGSAYALGEQARAGDIGRFLAQIPLLRRQMQVEDFAQALQLYGMRPQGESLFGEQTGTTTRAESGNKLGGLFNNLASILAFYAGMGAFGNKSPSSG